jgi:excinuclease ABC subunit C
MSAEAKNLKKRILAYARPTGHVSRIRMVAATSAIEFVSTATETEALLLEANLIKRLRRASTCCCATTSRFPISSSPRA